MGMSYALSLCLQHHRYESLQWREIIHVTFLKFTLYKSCSQSPVKFFTFSVAWAMTLTYPMTVTLYCSFLCVIAKATLMVLNGLSFGWNGLFDLPYFKAVSGTARQCDIGKAKVLGLDWHISNQNVIFKGPFKRVFVLIVKKMLTVTFLVLCTVYNV